MISKSTPPGLQATIEQHLEHEGAIVCQLIDHYGPYMDTKELAHCFKYANAKAVLEAVRRKTFPIPTMVFGSRRVASTITAGCYIYQQQKKAEQAEKEAIRSCFIC